jgi:hypothetical protein
LGNAYSALGQVEKAYKYLKWAKAIFEAIKSPYLDWVNDRLAELKGAE